MKALTLYPEWCLAILRLGKDVENRDWACPRAILGRPILLHAGAHLDGDTRDRRDQAVLRCVARMASYAGWDYSLPALGHPILRRGDQVVELRPSHVTRGAVVATMRISSCVQGARSGWAVPGSWHWMIADVRPLDRPVPCRGMPGLWDVSAEVEAAVREQLREVA